jgi:hypothetical protein
MDDASYNYSLIVDACADAEMMVAQVIGQTANHPWRAYLFKGALSEAGGGLPNGTNLAQQLGTAVATLLGYGVVKTPAGIVCTERPLEEIMRRNRNAGAFFVNPVFFYRIVNQKIYHTVPSPGVQVDFYGYDRVQDTYNKITANGTTLFPHTAIPIYIAGACSMLLKEEEYASQAQYYSQLFQQMLQQLAQGFAATDPLQPPAPVKGAEST